MSPRFIRLVQDSLLQTADRCPDRVALWEQDTGHTYREVRDAALAFAEGLRNRGFARGDRVAIVHENAYEAVVAIFGTLLADGIFFVLSPQTKKERLDYILEDSGARFMLVSSAAYQTYLEQRGRTSSLEGIFTTGLGDGWDSPPTPSERLAHVVATEAPRAASPKALSVDLASLIYTSGSTGFPKGVMMTHQAMTFVTESVIEYLRLDENHRILGTLPLAYGYGLYQIFIAFSLGAAVALERSSIYPADLVQRIRTSAISVFPGVPTQFTQLATLHARQPFSLPSVLRVTSAAAALPDSLIPVIEQIFPNALIFKMYGLTECKRVSFLEPELIHEKPGSVGRAIPGTEAYVLREDGSPASPGEVGQLHVRGAHVMMGYWNQPERTAETLTSGRHPQDRVLNTTDWFRQDADGFLYFAGRSDDIIKTRGEKVSPVEVENVLYGIDGVQEAAVIGVDDAALGQAVRAYVVLEEGATLNARELKRACARRLEDFMVPKTIILRTELPKTDNGKIRKTTLVEEAQAE